MNLRAQVGHNLLSMLILEQDAHFRLTFGSLLKLLNMDTAGVSLLI